MVTVPLVVFGVLVVGTCGYRAIGLGIGRDWPLLDCLYFTVISLTTVGYGETLPGFHHPLARSFTIIFLLVGYGVMLWAFSSLIALFVEGRLLESLGRMRMIRRIEQLRDHYILCGVGETGIHIWEELRRTRRQVVLVELGSERLAAALRQHEDAYFLQGDAEDEKTLRAAGIDRAAGLIACLPEDKDNVYLVLTARQLNPQLRIAARSIHMESQDKLRRAGANSVVSPNFIGGMRLASEMVRPHVTTFLDMMLRDPDGVIRLEEVAVPEGSALAGKTVAEADVQRHTNLLVIATRRADGEFDYNPGPAYRLQPGMQLVVLGDVSNIALLRELAKA